MPEFANSIDDREIAHFAKDSDNWWDEDGPFRPLHRLNPVRMAYIRDQVCAHFQRDPQSLRSLSSLAILDIGCGGGLTCEPLTRLGAAVTGVDADAQAIRVAVRHAADNGLAIDYRHGAAETLVQDKARFDVVLALEIIEHVQTSDEFVAMCAALCKPGGLVVFSTLNRTARCFALGIIAAEYILGWVPRGTHDWKKFIRPAELAGMARGAGLSPGDVTGMVFDPLKNGFRTSKTDLAVNYFLSATKRP